MYAVVACKAYTKAMTSSNISEAFKKTDIDPYSKVIGADSKVIGADKLYPSESFRAKDPRKRL